MLAAGILSTLYFMVTAAAGVALEWMSDPGIAQFYLGWSIFSVNSWCWTLFVLYIGMRYLDFTNKWLRYGGETIMPLFVLHQPVIIVIAMLAAFIFPCTRFFGTEGWHLKNPAPSPEGTAV